jgi:hypothetical protein
LDNNAARQFAERDALRSDLIAGKAPARVPVYALFTLEAACGLADIDLFDAHYDLSLAEKAHEKICETFYSDALPSINLRYPPVYDILGAKNWVLGSTGAVQHSGIEMMHEDEYDEFIAGPYKMIVETFMPRICSSLEGDAAARSLNFAKAFYEYKRQVDGHVAIYGRMAERFGYSSGVIAGPTTVAPFDFIADQFRGFTNITVDIYRIPDKVEAAVKAVYPYMLKLALAGQPESGGSCFIPLHLAPFINLKQFESLYWPTLRQMVEEADSHGVSSALFIEQDWTRYLDYLETLPKSTIGWVEKGDPVKFTEQFGKDHVFGGFYDPTITLTQSKESCIDEAKRLLDVCMKSGHFYFTFDRSIMDIKSIDIAKLQAVLEWIRDNAAY